MRAAREHVDETAWKERQRTAKESEEKDVHERKGPRQTTKRAEMLRGAWNDNGWDASERARKVEEGWKKQDEADRRGRNDAFFER